MRRSRWKPMCPECGYSLRKLASAECPECGNAFPTASKVFRRWACRRIPWDRRDRGSMLSAYVRTVALIVFLPWKASRGVVIPDNWPRCKRWAGAHFVVAVLLAVLLANGQTYPRWLIQQIWPPLFDPPNMGSPKDLPGAFIATWFAQSFAAWFVAMALPVVIGMAISFGLPGGHRAAKLGGIKWSLYLTCIAPYLLAIGYGYQSLFPKIVQVQFPVQFSYPQVPIEIAPSICTGVYGLWWSIGMGMNLYNKRRGIAAMLWFALAFALSWVILCFGMFPPSGLEALL